MNAFYKSAGVEVQTVNSGDFLGLAKTVWQEVSRNKTVYTSYHQGNSIKKRDDSSGGLKYKVAGSTIDCSSYVSWVLAEYGYTDFIGSQKSTYYFKNTNLNKKYGWTEISIAQGEDITSKVKPGDIVVRRSGDSGHMNIVASVSGKKVYGYDCGKAANWLNEDRGKGGKTVNISWFMTDTYDRKTGRPGKIIRVTPVK